MSKIFTLKVGAIKLPQTATLQTTDGRIVVVKVTEIEEKDDGND